MATFPQVILKPGREKSLLQHHPWVFSGAIARVEGEPDCGSVVTLVSSRGEFLACGSWSPVSQLRCRVWSWHQDETVDREFFRKKLLQAKALRRSLGLDADAACRLVYSESDGLPGVIVDRFGDYAVVQFLSCGAEFFRQIILEELMSVFNFKGIYERSDAAVRSKEGLAERCELAAGESIPDEVCFRENGLTYYADLRHGQKTGFYFDLREVRKKVEALSAGKRVLNAFAFTGGFACAALRGGAASVLNLDSSRPSLEQAEKNLLANGFTDNWENRVCDGFTELKKLIEAKEKFDLVILDPPKLIDSRGALERGCRAYQYLARCGFNLLAPGGIMLNMSCSGQMSLELLQKITFAAALEAGRTAGIIDTVRQAADHPVSLSVPETFYLKGFITRAE